MPVPDKLTCCGLSGLLSAIERAAAWEPRLPGLNVTAIVHEFPAGTLLPHVFVCANSLDLVPVVVIPEILSAAVPVLVRVIVRGVLFLFTRTPPKLRLAGTSSTVPAETVIAAVADFVGSSTEVAVNTKAGLAGSAAGAV